MEPSKKDLPSLNRAVAPPTPMASGVAAGTVLTKDPANTPPFPVKHIPVANAPPAAAAVSKEKTSLPAPPSSFSRPQQQQPPVPPSQRPLQTPLQMPAKSLPTPTIPQRQTALASTSQVSRSSAGVDQSQSRPAAPHKMFQKIQAQQKLAQQNKNTKNPPLAVQAPQQRSLQPSQPSRTKPIQLHMPSKQQSLLPQSNLQQQPTSQPHRQHPHQTRPTGMLSQHSNVMQIKADKDEEKAAKPTDSSENGAGSGAPKPQMIPQSIRMRNTYALSKPMAQQQSALASMSVHSVAALQMQAAKQQPKALQSHLQRTMLQPQQKSAPTPASVASPAMPPRQLQVEDALQYLDKVKQEFEDRPDTYNQFLEIMKNFKAQTIDTPGVIHRVSELFRGHDRLILGFNAFLPPGFKIGAADIPKLQQKSFRQSQSQSQSPPAATATPVQIPPKRTTPRVAAPPETTKAKPAEPRTAQSAAATAFDQAITYVTKIKQRFENDPKNTYQAFLDILHTYQQEQRSIKDVLDKVSELLRDNHDLLQEFTLFLPENVQEEAKNRLQRNISRQNALNARVAKRRNRDKANYRERKKRARMDDVMGTLPEQERRLFRQVRQVVTKDQWNEFLKALELFTEDILSRSELVVLVTDLFMDNTSLMDDFKSLLDRHVGNKFQIDEKWFELPLSEIETPNSRRCTPSYRSLPENFPNLMCSGRTPFDAGFLNDQWISVPVGSEDFNFKNMTKNPHEFALFACEDERFEVDMVIESNLSTIQILQPLAEEIQILMNQEESTEWQYRLDPQTLSAVHLKAICRIYGDHGREILELLRKNPAGAIPIIVHRMKAKDIEWRRVRAELRKGWNDVLHKHYYKALDYRSNSFRQNDKKMLTPKALVGEIRSLYERNTKAAAPAKPPAEPKDKDQDEDKDKNEDKDNAKGPSNTELNCDKVEAADQARPTTHTSDLSFEYHNLSMHNEVFSVLSYAVECGAVQKSEKESVANLWKKFLVPFFGLSSLTFKRKRNPSATTSQSDAMDVEEPTEESPSSSAAAAAATATASTSENPTETQKNDNDSAGATSKKADEPAAEGASPQKEASQPEAMDVETAGDSAVAAEKHSASPVSGDRPRETVVYGSVAMFLFLRLHRFIYERLSIAKNLCSMSHNTPLNRIKHPYEDENKADRIPLEGEGAETAKTDAATTKTHEEHSDFTHFLSTLYAVVDGTCDNSRFEDHCRNLMGTGSYHLHNIDKLIALTVKAMVTFATNHTSQRMRALFEYESDRKNPSPASYEDNCAALIRTEVTAGHTPKLEMFRFFLKNGVPAQTAGEAVTPHKEEADADDLLNLAALGIAVPSESNEVKSKSNLKASVEPEHGWQVVPRLTITYIPIKKNTDTDATGLNVGIESEANNHLEKMFSDSATDGPETNNEDQVTDKSVTQIEVA